MAADEEPDWLVQIYQEHGATLHRLVVLLGAEEESGRIVRSALLSLSRRGHRLIDPAERVEFLQEQVVHLARAVRDQHALLRLPALDDPRQAQLAAVIGELPVRLSEMLVVSHYLAVFGPDLAAIMRMSVRGSNQRLEIALETLRAKAGGLAGGASGGLESLSQELTAALRSAARSVQAPGTQTLAAELMEVGSDRGPRIGLRAVLILAVLVIALGLLLAMLTRSVTSPIEEPPPLPNAPSVASAQSLPAQVRGVPTYYVGRSDGLLYRELRDLPATGDLVKSALEALLNLAPLDPEYESAWSQGQVLDVSVTGDAMVIDLSSDAFSEIDSAERALSAQRQVVYTVTEIVGEPDLRVYFRADGGTPPPDFRSQVGFRREELAPMPVLWITSPQNLEQRPAGPIQITGTVKAGGGTPSVTITDGTGRVVLVAPAQTALSVNADGWRVWTLSTELTPGDYEIRVTVVNASTGVVRGENKTIQVS